MKKQSKELHWYDRLSKEESLFRQVKRVKKPKPKFHERNINVIKHKMVDFEKYIVDASQWVDEVSVLVKAGKRKDIAWNALRGVLHVIRDRMTPEEMFHLSAQLPMLIRGMFFEGYHFGGKPEKLHMEELEARLKEALGSTMDIDAKLVFKAVLLVLYQHVSEGELEDIYGTMPKDIHRLWDESIKLKLI